MLSTSYLDAIKKFEGFNGEARWDYAQHSNGFGTRARYAGEVIDQAEADRRFSDEVSKASDFVEKVAPGLDEGTKAALTSLTYNAGTAWADSGLGKAIAAGDLEAARSIFVQYNKAGGEVLGGLARRRLEEVTWIGQGTAGALPTATNAATAPISGAATSAAQAALEAISGSAQLSSVTATETSQYTRTPQSSVSAATTDAILMSLVGYPGRADKEHSSDSKGDKTTSKAEILTGFAQS